MDVRLLLLGPSFFNKCPICVRSSWRDILHRRLAWWPPKRKIRPVAASRHPPRLPSLESFGHSLVPRVCRNAEQCVQHQQACFLPWLYYTAVRCPCCSDGQGPFRTRSGCGRTFTFKSVPPWSRSSLLKCVLSALSGTDWGSWEWSAGSRPFNLRPLSHHDAYRAGLVDHLQDWCTQTHSPKRNCWTCICCEHIPTT